MTNDGKYIYQTDKTEKIWKMDLRQKNLIILCILGSRKSRQSMNWNGLMEKYTQTFGRRCNCSKPQKWAVEGLLDLSGLRKLINATPDDLNGIAYNPKPKPSS
jgi:hypothetical protein